MNHLLAEKFRSDPRIDQAKKLLLEALKDHQQSIKTNIPTQASFKKGYEETLEFYGTARGNALWFPYIGSGFGKGPLVELADGSVKYDMISGIGVHYWGHSHPEIISASINAALSDLVMQGNLQQNIDSVELVKLFLKISGLDHCFLTTSGAMACENALKIAFQKKYPAYRIFAFKRCFCGRTLTLSQITDAPDFREGLPPTITVDYIPFYDPQNHRESITQASKMLCDYITRYPKQHAGMIFEMIQGEAGFYPGNKEFFMSLIDILAENDIPVIVDEVQTFGRTTRPFAFQHYQLDPYVDIVTVGKLTQVCATLFRSSFAPRVGLLSQTFTASTSAIHVAKKILETFLSDNFFGDKGKISCMHNLIVTHLQRLSKLFPKVLEDINGIGAMISFTVFKGDRDKSKRFVHQLFQNGVIAFVAGRRPTWIRFLAPMMAIEPSDIDAVARILEITLNDASKW